MIPVPGFRFLTGFMTFLQALTAARLYSLSTLQCRVADAIGCHGFYFAAGLITQAGWRAVK